MSRRKLHSPPTKHVEHDDESFVREIARVQFQEPLKDKDYFCISLFGSDAGEVEQSVISHWCGRTETSSQYDIREGTPLAGAAYRDMMLRAKLPFAIVNTTIDLYVFRLIGGYGVVVSEIAWKYFRNLVERHPVVRTFSAGHVSVSALPPSILNHAPTKKLRLQVIKRDSFKCRICGRAPKDYVDVELHVHHILPWSLGGPTEAENLITLCKTCHDGLEPHHEPRLRSLMDEDPLGASLQRQSRDVVIGRLVFYMENVRKQLHRIDSGQIKKR